jgi:surface antigen
MRAKRALTAVCVLFVAATAIPGEAATRDSRTTQKQFRAVPAAQPQQPHRAEKPGAAAQPAARSPAARPRLAIAPQSEAFEALATPAIARMPAGGGTPILPVSVTSGLSCVPFARMATGMSITGDARLWWHNAAGTYARGQAPERGAVLAFTASGGMSRGHVAVVSRVVNARTILIDHANWAGPGIRRGTVMRGVTVVDVSDRNDWTAVRVQVGHSTEAFGRTYPTHGFIYNRPAGARILHAATDGLLEIAEAPSPHATLHARLAAAALAD